MDISLCARTFAERAKKMGLRSWIAAFLSGVSLFNLAATAWNLGLSQALQLMLDYYNAFLDVALGWATLPLQNVLNWIADRLDLPRFSLGDHWRHVFVLLWLYAFADVLSEIERKQSKAAAWTLVVGLIISTAASVASGVSPFEGGGMASVFWAIAGMVTYQVFRSAVNATVRPQKGWSWWPSFAHFAYRFPFADLVVGAIVLGVGCLTSAYLGGFMNGALLLAFLAGLAIRNVGQAFIFAANSNREKRADSEIDWRTMATAKLGVVILKALGVLVVLVLSNAGLRLVGL